MLETTPSKQILSVKELVWNLKRNIETHFSHVWVVGELSNFVQAASGHCYFNLKDKDAQIRGVMFRNAARMLRFEAKDGLEVLVYGSVSVYAPRGEMQVIIEKMEPKGIGALQLAFEQLKEKLEKEGLFDPQHKKPIPFLPRKIGVVTSSKGAAIHDILKVLRKRYPNIEVLLHPVAVQGDEAATQISRAIDRLNQFVDIDVLIVGRGGGSIEDLWAFNEEVVARAIFRSRIPVISAVGHEVDYTIADFVADVRAATPSNAAEIAVPEKAQLINRISNFNSRMRNTVHNRLRYFRLKAGPEVQKRMLRIMQQNISLRQQRVDDLLRTCKDLNLKRLENYKHRCALSTQKLFMTAPRNAIMNRKYALVSLREKMVNNIHSHLKSEHNKFSIALKALQLNSPKSQIKQARVKLDTSIVVLERAYRGYIKTRYSELSNTIARIESLNPMKILSRGFCLVTQENDSRPIADASEFSANDIMQIIFAKGRLRGVVKQVEKDQEQTELPLK